MVRDSNGLAIPFATITDCSNNGVMSDSSGNFELCIQSAIKNKIIVRSLGYLTDTFNVNNSKSRVEIVLKNKPVGLGEVAIVHRQDIKHKSMVSVFSAGKKEMALLNPQNVAEVLQTKTGFTNRSGYQVPITLRGLTGKRVLVLRNGLRRFSSYPSGYMSHTINVYDLERIDVEKGAASVIYGAGAMVGIINLVDKSPFKQKGFNAKLTTGYGTVNKEKNILACGGWSNGKLALKTAFRYRSADNFSYPDGTIAENSFYTDKDLFVSAGYKISPGQQVVFIADMHHGGPWGKPVGFNGSDYMRVQTKKERSDNLSVQYSYNLNDNINIGWGTFFSNENRVLVKNYYTAAGYMLSYVETTDFSDYYYGSRLTGTISITGKYRLTAGNEFYSFHISTPTDAVDYIEGLSFQNRVSHNARSNISGTFLENKYSLNTHIMLVAGIRYDYASVFEGDVISTEQDEERNAQKHALSGNVALSGRMAEHSRIKVNFARSFRMPETTELYADSYTSNGILYGNPDLKPEYCYSADLDYTYSSKVATIDFSPFLWLMDGMITKEEVKGMPGTNYQYVNIGKSRLWGGELTTEIPLESLFLQNDRLVFYAGAAYLNGTNVSDKGKYFSKGTPLDYVPPFNVKTNLTYDSPKGKKLQYTGALRTIYYSKQNRLGESSYATPAYLLVGCTLEVKFPSIATKPSVNLAINNLFNKEYYAYWSYLPAEGRDFRIFISFYFNNNTDD